LNQLIASDLVIELETLLQLARLAEGLLQDAAVEFVEGLRIDAVVVFGVVLGLEVLRAQAQELDEVEAVDHRGDLFRRDADPGACLAQALDRAARVDAGAQGEDAGDIHEEPRARLLEVDGAVVLDHEVADPTKWRHHLEGVAGHHAQEGAVALGRPVEPGAQLVAEALVAVKHAEVEKDRGVEQGLRVGFADPVGEARLPLVQGQAQLRVARHDVALAQREAAGGEVVVDSLREREQAPARLVDLAARDHAEHDPVVLVGGQRLLVAPLRAERDPGEVDAEQVVALAGEHDDAAGQRVVEGGDELRQLLGTDALRDQVEGELADVRARALQGMDVGRVLDAGADLAQADALQREQVALGHHALEDAVRVHHQQVAHAVGRHLQGGVVGGGGGRQLVRIGGHQLADRAGEVEGGQDHPRQQVALGDDAHRPAFVVDHHHAAQAQLVHALERAARGRVSTHENRVLLDQLAQAGGHGLLLGRALREGGLQLLAGLVEQAGDVLRAEQVEDRTHLHQVQEIVRAELEAEAVLDRDVGIGRRAAGGDRADREAFAGPQRHAGVLGDRGRTGLARLHLAALDDVEMAGDAHLRDQDVRAARMEGEHRTLGEEGERLGLHAVEGREVAQKVGAGAHQQVRGFGGHDGSVVG